MLTNRLLFYLLAILFFTSCAEKTENLNNPIELVPVENTSISEVPKVATLAFKISSRLGEGAFWYDKNQTLYWVDIEGQQLHLFHPETKTNRSFPTPSRIGTVVPQTDSTAVIALEDGVYIINTNNGVLSLLTHLEKDMHVNRFNDGKCDPNGNFWVGSMHLDQSEPMGSLYKVTPKGVTTKMLDSVTISNGIVWTQNATTMYYIDTPTGNIQAFDFDKKTSTVSNERTAVKVAVSDGYPDGMAIDSEDMLWVGLWNGNAVARYNPLTGELLEKISVPAHNVTACAFGGANLDELFITTSSLDMTKQERAQYPLAGSVFVTKPGVKGVPSALFGQQ